MTRRDDTLTLGEALRAAREDAKLSQDALALKLELKSGRKGIGRWEKDENVPDEEHRQQLIQELNLPSDFFQRVARAEARLSHRLTALENLVGQIELRLSEVIAAQGQ